MAKSAASVKLVAPHARVSPPLPLVPVRARQVPIVDLSSSGSFSMEAESVRSVGVEESRPSGPTRPEISGRRMRDIRQTAPNPFSI